MQKWNISIGHLSTALAIYECRHTQDAMYLCPAITRHRRLEPSQIATCGRLSHAGARVCIDIAISHVSVKYVRGRLDTMRCITISPLRRVSG